MGGQVSESVRDLYVGTLEALPTSVFPKFDYLALGHIHRAQAITKDGRFRYSGSPIPLSFDELGRNKSLVVIDTSAFGDQALAMDLFDERQEPIQLHTIPTFQPMQSLKGNLKDVLKQIADLQLAESKTKEGSFLEGKSLWLEVTVIADEYLSDVHKRLVEAIEGKPIELLRVMRKSVVEAKRDAFESRQTLSELTVKEVFEKSLQGNADIDEEESVILTNLFNHCLIEMEESQEQQV